MIILAIETSCDETSASVINKNKNDIRVLSNVTATSLELHAKTGGIIPENAARMQVKYVIPVIVKAVLSAFEEEKTSSKSDWQIVSRLIKDNINSIAVTIGPGLIGSLLVGVETAKTLSFVFNKPIIPVNHLLAHIYANFIDKENDEINYPFIGLIVSGGHTDLLYFKSYAEFKWLGGTRDDAAGEAMDKIGRLLGIPYPAGPEIERLASLSKEKKLRFKSPLISSDDFDFSFSGLKTEVLRFVQKNIEMPDELKNEVCYATQKSIIDVLVRKTLKAATEFKCKNILVGGGVSANQTLINELKLKANSLNLKAKIFSAEKIYCTDNAAMIGAYALINGKPIPWQEIMANPELYFD